MKKFLIIILIIILLAAVYFLYSALKNRYFRSSPKIITNDISNTVSDQNNGGNHPREENKINDGGAEIKSSALDVTISPKDCDNECIGFNDENELKYCQEVCGLSPEQPTDNCQSAKGLEKDYCLKDLAIKNNDFNACEQISDSGIKKACKNRITQDIMESQSQESL